MLRLHDPEDVSARIDDPGSPGEAHVGNSIFGFRVGQVVFLDRYAAAAEIRELGSEVRNAPGKLGLAIRCSGRAGGYGQLRSVAAAEDDPLVVCAEDLEPQRVMVQGPTRLQVCRQQNREHEMIAYHGHLSSSDTYMAPLSLAAGWDQTLFEQEPSWIAAGATIDALCEPFSRRVLSRSAAKDVEAARAIERTLLDYFEGWFDGDAARMKRALHPELAKRPTGVDPSLAGRLG